MDGAHMGVGIEPEGGGNAGTGESGPAKGAMISDTIKEAQCDGRGHEAEGRGGACRERGT